MVTSTPAAERAWLARRAGFGFAPGEHRTAISAEARLDQLIDPEGAGIAPEGELFGDLAVSLRTDDLANEGPPLLASWITHQAETARPLEDLLTFFWHDHFAVSIAAVPHTELLRDHLELLRRHGLGNFRDLLRAVTIDPAMLLFLNGAMSEGTSPNENYGRELLELYGLGIGNYDEDDVRAAARALTGWTIRRSTGVAYFAPGRHDDRPQELLGRTGVHDLDTVIDAVISHPACPRFIAGKLAGALLGEPVDEGLVADLATDFAASGLELAPLVRSILAAGLAGAQRSFGRSPVHLLSSLMRATGARPDDRRILALLQGAGQLPGNPPNVGGFPPPAAWFAASTVSARYGLASTVADTTPSDAVVLELVAERDWAELAAVLARPQGFEPGTIAALDRISVGFQRQSDRAVLALALASPEMAVV